MQILQAQGKYQHQPPRPFVLGSELAGRIADSSPIPDGCPFRRGDRVFGAAQGAFRERVAVGWQAFVPLLITCRMTRVLVSVCHALVRWTLPLQTVVCERLRAQEERALEGGR